MIRILAIIMFVLFIAAAAHALTDAGNKICPVTGEAVDGKNTYVYKGKSYNLCCPMCVGAFEKNPEKYSVIADKETAKKK